MFLFGMIVLLPAILQKEKLEKLSICFRFLLLFLAERYDISYRKRKYHIMIMTKYIIYETKDYRDWLEELSRKSQTQVRNRILKIEDDGYFGHHKHLEDSLWKLKFNDGRSVYYALESEFSKVVLLLGGNKNGQDKDIKKAAAIIRKIVKS